MANSTYFPQDKSSQAAWYLNMALEFPSVATLLGFTAPEWPIASTRRSCSAGG